MFIEEATSKQISSKELEREDRVETKTETECQRNSKPAMELCSGTPELGSRLCT